MIEHLVPKIINLCVAYMEVGEGREQERKLCKLSNSRAKAGPMSEAIALGLTCVPRLDLDHFESQSDSTRLNQRLPRDASRYLNRPGKPQNI